MAANNVLVTFEEINSMAGQLRNGGDAIGQQLTSLLNAVQALVNSGWRGQAAGAFETLFTNANAGWKEVETSLVGMAEMLQGIGTQYQEQESSIASRLAG